MRLDLSRPKMDNMPVKEVAIMAYVLKPTPPVRGRDAVRVFEETILHGPKKVSPEFKQECLALARTIKINAKKPLKA